MDQNMYANPFSQDLANTTDMYEQRLHLKFWARN